MTQKFRGREESKARQLAVDLAKIKARAGKIGLFRTMQALEYAVKEVGWEIVEKMRK